MAKFLETTFEISESLDAFADAVQEKVALGGVAAAAEVFYDEVKVNASGARSHPKQVTGNLFRSIYRYYDEKGSTLTVKNYFVGWNHKKAPHGHLIEFGTSQSPAYPFLRPAYDRAGEAGKAGIARMAELMAKGIK